MRINIIYGIYNITEGARISVKKALENAGCEVVDDSTVRQIKSGIDQAVTFYAKEEQLVLIISRLLEDGNPFTIHDLLRYQQAVPNVKIVFIIEKEMKGSELLFDMSNNGMYLGMYADETSHETIRDLIIKGRTVENAKQYYGVSNMKNVSKMMTIEGGIQHIIQPVKNDKEYLDRVRFVHDTLSSEDEFVACVKRLPDKVKAVLAQNKNYRKYVEDFVIANSGTGIHVEQTKSGGLFGKFKKKDKADKKEKVMAMYEDEPEEMADEVSEDDSKPVNAGMSQEERERREQELIEAKRREERARKLAEEEKQKENDAPSVSFETVEESDEGIAFTEEVAEEIVLTEEPAEEVEVQVNVSVDEERLAAKAAEEERLREAERLAALAAEEEKRKTEEARRQEEARREAERLAAEEEKRKAEEERRVAEEAERIRKALAEQEELEKADLEEELRLLKKQKEEEEARERELRRERIRIEAEERAKAEIAFKREEAERKAAAKAEREAALKEEAAVSAGIVKNAVKSAIRRTVIGVAGAQRHVGCTHQSLLIAHCLSAMGFKVAVVEDYNQADKVFDIIAGENGKNGNDVFTFSGVDYYPCFSLRNLPGLNAKNYNFVVVDFGLYDDDMIEEYGRCSLQILVSGSRVWETIQLSKVFGSVTESQLKTYNFLFIGTPEEKKASFRKDMQPMKNVFFGEYAPSPYSSEGYQAIKNILGDFIVAEDAVKKKSGIFSKWR